MLASQIPAAPQLMDLQDTFRLSAVKFGLEFDDPVHESVLGRALADAGQQQHCAIRYCSLGLQFMDEFLELSAGGCGFFDGRQSVEDEAARAARLNFAAQQVQKRWEAFLFEHTKGADVVEAVRDDCFFEKAELPDMKQHPRMVLGQQCHIERTATLGDMVEADLVAEGGLPCPGRTLNYKDAAAQHRVQSRHSGRDAFERRPAGFFN